MDPESASWCHCRKRPVPNFWDGKRFVSANCQMPRHFDGEGVARRVDLPPLRGKLPQGDNRPKAVSGPYMVAKVLCQVVWSDHV